MFHQDLTDLSTVIADSLTVYLPVIMAVQVVSFFDQFPDFDCNPDSPISNEFKRLGKARNWRPGSKTWTKNWNRCMGNEYNRLIGSRISNLETWQVMCRKVGLGDEFTAIRQCKKVGRSLDWSEITI
jgi:hypothetical protein